ncbi:MULTISPECIES: MtrAB system histidine kinase MtrB [unclassified Corynebacterium]|uniref:MtrAB system histidine kinase MtrB n=1 Tax=unclassified Corynebacterium TaxID=2624378 RepID=UPI001EF57038|nr:HAMP domain-containing histidine kinase [Corynebacterium sp. ACRQK]MCG7263814.1 HAMP domain-containing histidine kinase [Corynebacterium sp. ACRQL]
MEQEQAKVKKQKPARQTQPKAPGFPQKVQGKTLTAGATFWSVLRDFFRRPRDTWRRLINSIRLRWHQSIQLRVIGSVLASSTFAFLLIGFLLVGFLSQQLLATKFSEAIDSMDRARTAVEEQISATDSSNPVSVRLTSARAVLTNRSAGVEQTSVPVYDSVLIANNASKTETRIPNNIDIPENLREFVHQGQVAYQYASVDGENGSYKALIIGSPVYSDIPGLELYLLVPLTSEEATLNLMRGLLMAGGIVLIILLLVIGWVFSQQIIGPVRAASKIAEKLAAGHLHERMVVDGQDEVARLAYSFNDMAEKLSTQIRNLEEFGSLQRQFTSDVSHELRTPLTTVRMAADMIEDNADELDPLTARAAHLMTKELDRFETLLSDLLEISRHDAGVANLSAEKVDVRGVVRSALQQVRAIAEEIGTEFNVDLPEDPVIVAVDSRRVERILRNLLANAVDHSEGNPIDVKMAIGKDALAVAVIDHGVGLKPGEEEMVFNRFWRSDPSRERRTGGTGLGLAIAKEDANLHGGRLEAIGEPGVGACFLLTLPLEQGHKVNASPLPLAVGAEGVTTQEQEGGDDE